MGTSLDQFRACLGSSYARAELDVNLTDEEARRIASDDELSARWYDWWVRRPEGAQIAAASRTAAASSKRAVRLGWVGILASPIAILLACILLYAGSFVGSPVGWWIGTGVLAIVIAIAGILLSAAALRGSTGDCRATIVGYIGLVLSLLTAVSITAATVLLAVIVWR